MSGKYRSDNVWKAVKQKIKNSQHYLQKSVVWAPIGVNHNRTNWPGSWSGSFTLWGILQVRLRLRARTRSHV